MTPLFGFQKCVYRNGIVKCKHFVLGFHWVGENNGGACDNKRDFLFQQKYNLVVNTPLKTNPNPPCPFSARSFYVCYIWRMVTFCLDLLPSPTSINEMYNIYREHIFLHIFNIYQHSVCIFIHNHGVHPQCPCDCELDDSRGLLL